MGECKNRNAGMQEHRMEKKHTAAQSSDYIGRCGQATFYSVLCYNTVKRVKGADKTRREMNG